MRLSAEQIAKVCHEANKAYCEGMGDTSQPSWGDAPGWQKESAIMGVKAKLNDPDASPRQMHAMWVANKIANGWNYGPVKDAEKKTHPCIVPYDQLPVEQRIKDVMFSRIVESLSMA